MPEGDTVWHTAALLREHLAGRTLTRCDVRVPRFATVDLTGQVVDEVVSRGKHLFIRVAQAGDVGIPQPTVDALEYFGAGLGRHFSEPHSLARYLAALNNPGRGRLSSPELPSPGVQFVA